MKIRCNQHKLSVPLYLLIFLMSASCASHSGTGHSGNSNADFSIANDKLKHLSYSIGISAATAAYYRHDQHKDRCNAATIGFGISMSLGAGKETYDKYIKKTLWDWNDVAWNFAGSSIGSLIGSGCH